MTPDFQIRADFNRDTIVMYQAYDSRIADAALAARTFVAPFSFTRMTWIKPSFLWLMVRSNWAGKSGQERILAVRITRSGWEDALGRAEMTSPEPRVYRSAAAWEKRFATADVHVQWDPERSLRGAKLGWRSIQVGLGRNVIRDFAEHWIVGIRDLTPLAKKIRTLCAAGKHARAREHLPPEKPYPLSRELAARIGADFGPVAR